ncbi:SpoT-like ppGpp synthesis/degradation protein [Microbacterium phage A3Wally]|nr:SpoT-like ppGpp synthesis/degradation protein [Microbacterium phage A3Wally]
MITFRDHDRPLKDLDSVSLASKLRQLFIDRYPVAQTEKLNDAIQIASYLHRTDTRRGERGNMPNPPYIEHPLRVALRLHTFGVRDVETYFAAVLHDTVEDHPFEFADFEGVDKTTDEAQARTNALNFIGGKFGYVTAATLESVSNPILPEGTPKAEKVASYLAHVKAEVQRSPRALILKFSDFVDNAGSLHHHYAYNDPKVKYFIERYSPLIPVYRENLMGEHHKFIAGNALRRLQDVERQFASFRAGLDIAPPF